MCSSQLLRQTFERSVSNINFKAYFPYAMSFYVLINRTNRSIIQIFIHTKTHQITQIIVETPKVLKLVAG